MANLSASTGKDDHPLASTGSGESLIGRYLPRLAVGLLLAVLVVSGLALFSDVRQLGSAFRQFDWSLAAPVLLLTLANYALRFGKWEVYLRRVGIPRMELGTSALIFLAGFSMSLTPGKVGEVIKGVLVRRRTGAPISRTAAVIAAERMTDGLAMLALAAIGLTQFSYGRPILALTILLVIAVILVLQRPRLILHALARFEGIPLVGKTLVHAHHFLEASNVLLRPSLLGGAVAVGIVSWGMECAALFLILTGLGLDPSWHLLLVATFVLSVSSVFGAISMLPGGLGVAEASVAAMLLLLIDDPTMTKGVAAAATLLVRFSTLWFGILLGFVALAMLQRTRRVSSEDAFELTTAPGSTTETTIGGSR
ncbi:MAG TPA: lysylphosphatidylglycerol synthase transmembrane domain-containing protein [Thermomicrobiales bacterium]|nr:lysylphosphatidylglycerol synthase transmembrane domain-containing protein [Thermomicrobiales bacterium]